MTNRNHTVTVVVSFITMLSAGSALGQNWPQWRGPNRDAKATGFIAPKSWPKELTQKWKVTVGESDATPALVDGKLYVFARQDGKEVALCLNTADGKEAWRNDYDALAATGPAGRHPGPRSSPTVDGGKVVTFGVRGTLSCLDAATGKVLWRKDDFSGAWPKFFTSSSSIVVDELCIAQLGKPEEGGIVAYDMGTGTEKWKWTGDGPGYASPVLLNMDGAKIIIAETDKKIIGINVADGKLSWEAPFAGRGMSYNAATPIVDGQTLIYCGSGRGATAVQISKDGGAIAAKELWSNPDNSVQFNTPVLKDGLLYGLSQRGDLFCINAKNGQTAWTHSTGERGGFGSIVDAGPVLLALAPGAQLIAFEPGDKEYKELARYKVADKQTYAYPVVAGSQIYIEDQDSVTLWTID